jgi:hypothetical protein
MQDGSCYTGKYGQQEKNSWFISDYFRLQTFASRQTAGIGKRHFEGANTLKPFVRPGFRGNSAVKMLLSRLQIPIFCS